MTETPTFPDQPSEPSWQQSDGHLSDESLTAIVDGQEAIVPGGALDHLASCASCQARSGEIAFLAAVADSAMAHPTVGPSGACSSVAVERWPRPAAPAVRFPVVGLLAALVVAGLGALPSAALFGRAAFWLAVDWRDALGVAVRTSAVVARRLAEALGPAFGWAPLLGALVLLAIGVGVARALPRRKGDWA